MLLVTTINLVSHEWRPNRVAKQITCLLELVIIFMRLIFLKAGDQMSPMSRVDIQVCVVVMVDYKEAARLMSEKLDY